MQLLARGGRWEIKEFFSSSDENYIEQIFRQARERDWFFLTGSSRNSLFFTILFLRREYYGTFRMEGRVQRKRT